MSFELPSVASDFDGQCAALDEAIREAASDFRFTYVSPAPKFSTIQRVPSIIYELIKHYTSRGFICEYDGDAGTMTISWSHPNMSYLENKQITRAVPELIPNLGIGFRASLVYLCMTNNTDLRKHSNVTMIRELKKGIKDAANLGNTEIEFGFPDVPAPAITNLFKGTFDALESSGFRIMYNTNKNIFVTRWGDTIELNFGAGTSSTVTSLNEVT